VLVDQIGGWPNAVALAGRWAYVGLGPRVLAVDLDGPLAPRLMGRSEPLGGPVSGLAVQGERLYAATGADEGLAILDLSTPESPRRIGALTGIGAAEDVAVRGDRAYVVSSTDPELIVVDVREPRSPRVLFASGGYPAQRAVAGADRLVLGGGINRNWPLCDGWGYTHESRPLYALDAADPAAVPEQLHAEAFASDAAGRIAVALLEEPDRLAVWDLGQPGPGVELPLPIAPFGGRPTSLATDGRWAVVATTAFPGEQQGPALHLIDLRDPAAPRNAVTIPVGEVVQGLALEENRVVATLPGHGLLSVTLGAPGEPPRLGRLDLPTGAWQLTRGPGWLLGVDDCQAEILADEDGAPLRHVATYRHEVTEDGERLGLRTLYRSGDSVYLAAIDDDWAIDRLDLDEPAAPRSRQVLAGAGRLETATAAGGYLYLGKATRTEFIEAHYSLQVVDLREQDRPRLGPERILSDLFDRIYRSEAGTFAQGRFGGTLYRVDLTDPRAPGFQPLSLCGAAWSSTGWRQMVVHGRYGYVLTDSEAGLVYIVDLAARPRPRLMGTLALDGPVDRLVDAGDARLWLIMLDGPVLAYGLQDPFAPTPAFRLHVPDWVTDLSVRGDLLDVATDATGLWRYRLPAAAAPAANAARRALSLAQAEHPTCARAWLPALAQP
jgi:hypothetical protein